MEINRAKVRKRERIESISGDNKRVTNHKEFATRDRGDDSESRMHTAKVNGEKEH
jgi:hypothetical protein